MKSKGVSGRTGWQQHAKQYNPRQRQKGLGSISEHSRLSVPMKCTGVSRTVSQGKGQFSQSRGFCHFAEGDYATGEAARARWEGCQRLETPTALTLTLSYLLVPQLAHRALGLQRKMHSEAEARIGRRRTARMQSPAPSASPAESPAESALK